MSCMIRPHRSAAIVYGTPAGVGGLGHSISAAITAVSMAKRNAIALGPGAALPWTLPGGTPAVDWVQSPTALRPWMVRYSWLRWQPGQVTMICDRNLARWAAEKLEGERPESIYVFTQVALEALRFAS